MSATDRFLSVVSFEVRRTVIGWRFPLCLVVAAVLFWLSLGTAMTEDVIGRFLYPIAMCVPLLVSIYAVVSFADNISDEFEKGTGLVMLTQPIGRYPLFAGKFVAAYLPGLALVALYYVAAAVVCTVNWGYIPAVLWESFLLALLYLFAALGVCGLISSISPGSNVSFVVCLLLMVVALFYFQNVSFGTEPWYVLGYDSRIIANHVMGVSTVFDGSMSTTDYQPLVSTASVMMCTYGAVTSVVSAILFRYRQI